jgi:ankyrin repeat protein
MCIGVPSYGQQANTYDNHGWTALMHAAYEGKTDSVRALIAAGAHVDAKVWDPHGGGRFSRRHETALLLAVFVARLEKYDIPDPRATPLHPHAPEHHTRQLNAGAGNVDCVRALIAAGANLEAKDRDGMTALIESAILGNADCVKALIAAGADVNAKDRHGKTALMSAKSADVADLLRSAGAN